MKGNFTDYLFGQVTNSMSYIFLGARAGCVGLANRSVFFRSSTKSNLGEKRTKPCASLALASSIKHLLFLNKKLSSKKRCYYTFAQAGIRVNA